MIYINSTVQVEVYVTVVDGRILLQSSGHAQQVNVRHLVQGIYFLHITDQEGKLIKVEKVMKQ